MAKAAYDGGTYDDSIDFSKQAIATLDAIPGRGTRAVVEPV